MNFKRGDVWLVNLGQNDDYIQSGIRPVLIVSWEENNKHSKIVQVLPISTSDKRFVMHYQICNSFVTKPSYVLIEQITTIQSDKLHKYLGTLSEVQMSIISHMMGMQYGIVT